MNKMRLFIIVVSVYFLSFFEQKAISEISIDVDHLIVQDFHSGKILYETEADEKIYPASMTKIMTAIVTFDLLKKGETSLDEMITISEKAWRMSQSGYSSMFIMLNDQVSVEDLLKGIIIVSGNDACVALAEGLSGSEEDFVEYHFGEKGIIEVYYNEELALKQPIALLVVDIQHMMMAVIMMVMVPVMQVILMMITMA